MQFEVLLRQAERKVQLLDEAVGLPRPFDLNLFLDRLEQHRGRPIDLHAAAETAGGPCGLWIKEASRDVIAYAERTSAFHQSAIILHECGHMIGDHQGACVLSIDDAQRLAPSVQPELIQHMFGRSAYTTFEEQEAEMIGCLIRLAAARPARRRASVVPRRQENSAYFNRVEQIFG